MHRDALWGIEGCVQAVVAGGNHHWAEERKELTCRGSTTIMRKLSREAMTETGTTDSPTAA